MMSCAQALGVAWSGTRGHRCCVDVSMLLSVVPHPIRPQRVLGSGCCRAGGSIIEKCRLGERRNVGKAFCPRSRRSLIQVVLLCWSPFCCMLPLSRGGYVPAPILLRVGGGIGGKQNGCSLFGWCFEHGIFVRGHKSYPSVRYSSARRLAGGTGIDSFSFGRFLK